MVLQNTISEQKPITEQLNLSIETEYPKDKTFKKIHTINLWITILCSISYLSIIGILYTMWIVGITQLVLSYIIYKNYYRIESGSIKVSLKFYKKLVIYFITSTLSLAILGFVLLKLKNGDVGGIVIFPILVILIFGGGALSFYHLNITKKLKEQEGYATLQNNQQ